MKFTPRGISSTFLAPFDLLSDSARASALLLGMASSSSYESFAIQLAALGKQRAAAAATAILPDARPQPSVAAFWNPGDKEECKKRLRGSLIKTTTGGGAEFWLTRVRKGD